MLTICGEGWGGDVVYWVRSCNDLATVLHLFLASAMTLETDDGPTPPRLRTRVDGNFQGRM